MRLSYQSLGVAVIAGFFFGFVSFQRSDSEESASSSQMREAEVETVMKLPDSSGFKTFWRDVHGPPLKTSAEVSPEAAKVSGRETYRLIGVVAIGSERVAYLSTADEKVVALKKGEGFGEDKYIKDINKKSLTYINAKNENQVLSLYPMFKE